MVGGMYGVEQDVIPYGVVAGDRARLQGLNVVGLKRHGFDRKDIRALTQAYKIIFSAQDTLSVRVGRASEKLGESAVVGDIVNFIRGESARPLCQPGADRGI